MRSGTSAGRRPWRRARRCDAPGGGEFDRGGSCSGAEAVAVAGIPGGRGAGVFVSLVRQVSIRGRGAGFRRPSHWALSKSDCLRRWGTRTRQGRRGKKERGWIRTRRAGVGYSNHVMRVESAATACQLGGELSPCLVSAGAFLWLHAGHLRVLHLSWRISLLPAMSMAISARRLVPAELVRENYCLIAGSRSKPHGRWVLPADATRADDQSCRYYPNLGPSWISWNVCPVFRRDAPDRLRRGFPACLPWDIPRGSRVTAGPYGAREPGRMQTGSRDGMDTQVCYSHIRAVCYTDLVINAT